MKAYVKPLLNILTKTNMNVFHKYEHKNLKKVFLSHIKLKLQPRTQKLNSVLFNVNCSVITSFLKVLFCC